MRNHEDWYRRFKESLDAHNEQIGGLSQGLAAEAESRKTGQDKLTEAVQSVKDTLSFLKGAAWFVMGSFGVGLTLLLAWVGKKWLGL